jgi:hypothetical protein
MSFPEELKADSTLEKREIIIGKEVPHRRV